MSVPEPAVPASAGPDRGAIPGRPLDPVHVASAALVLLVILNAVLTPNFATLGNLQNVLLQVSVVALVGVGLTLVIATGGIDLSVGSVMAISGALAATLLPHGVAVAAGTALLGAAAVGLLNGWVVARLGVQPIVVTLATLIAGRGLAQVLSNDGELVTIHHAGFEVLGRGYLGLVPVRVLVAVAVVAGAVFALRATAFGRYVLAAGGNPAAARLAGVPVAATLVTV
jgi:ribose/xylose/arabinose/galactoside ABC-type transport system permease subunit